jgi:hypothetical protein
MRIHFNTFKEIIKNIKLHNESNTITAATKSKEPKVNSFALNYKLFFLINK